MHRCHVGTARLLLLVVAVAAPLVGPGPVAAGASVATVLVAGDVHAGKPDSRDAETAAVVASQPGFVIVAGDSAGRSGTYRDYRSLYARTWGRFLSRTRATPGNHDYFDRGAAGYFRYFGWRAGSPGRGYQSFRVGSWRVVTLDSEVCKWAPGCDRGSPQYSWLKGILSRSSELCTLAVWHTPRFSSGKHGNDARVQPLVSLLYRAGAEIIVNGHDHDYERLAPARPDGEVDEALGIRQFVVGTGGGGLRGPGPNAVPHSAVFESSTWGVLRLRLHKDHYTWRFLPIEGRSFEDTGSGRCHGPLRN